MMILDGFQTPTAINFDWNVSENEYRADERLNFHRLADYKRDPRAFHDGFYDVHETTDAMRFGTALHALILQGDEQYKKDVASFNPPVNPKTGEPYGALTNAYKDARAAFETENSGKTIISANDEKLCMRLRDEFQFHPIAPEILGRADWARSEANIAGEIALRDNSTIAVKGRIDRYSEMGLIDLKTTSQLDDGSGKDRFRYTVYDYKYLVQLGFYHLILTECYNAPYVPAWIIAIEKNPPNRVAVYAITSDVIQKARDVARDWLESYANAVKLDDFASRYDQLQTISQYQMERDL